MSIYIVDGGDIREQEYNISVIQTNDLKLKDDDVKCNPYLYPFIQKLWEVCFAQAEMLEWNIEDKEFPY